jgi:hypothetical protein
LCANDFQDQCQQRAAHCWCAPHAPFRLPGSS